MTSNIPHSFQLENLYVAMLLDIEEENPALIHVTAPDWLALLAWVGPLRRTIGSDEDGTPIMRVKDAYGLMRTFRLKRPLNDPEGELDLTTDVARRRGRRNVED